MNNHPLESLIKQYLEQKDITKETFELYYTVLKQYTLYLKENQEMFENLCFLQNQYFLFETKLLTILVVNSQRCLLS